MYTINKNKHDATIALDFITIKSLADELIKSVDGIYSLNFHPFMSNILTIVHIINILFIINVDTFSILNFIHINIY